MKILFSWTRTRDGEESNRPAVRKEAFTPPATPKTTPHSAPCLANSCCPLKLCPAPSPPVGHPEPTHLFSGLPLQPLCTSVLSVATFYYLYLLMCLPPRMWALLRHISTPEIIIWFGPSSGSNVVGLDKCSTPVCTPAYPFLVLSFVNHLLAIEPMKILFEYWLFWVRQYICGQVGEGRPSRTFLSSWSQP